MEHIGARKALGKLSPNTTRKPRDSEQWKRPERAPRTLFGCSICKIPFCKRTNAGYLILSDLTPKNKRIYQNTIALGQY